MGKHLADTNFLIRYVDRTSPQHEIVREALRTLKAQRDTVYMTAQNGIEFWNVATRPLSKNGLGYTLTLALRRLRVMERVFPLLPDNPAIYAEWKALVKMFGVSGVQVHDTRLVAVMLAHGVENILTFNGSDFARFTAQGITVTDPLTVAPAPASSKETTETI